MAAVIVPAEGPRPGCHGHNPLLKVSWHAGLRAPNYVAPKPWTQLNELGKDTQPKAIRTVHQKLIGWPRRTQWSTVNGQCNWILYSTSKESPDSWLLDRRRCREKWQKEAIQKLTEGISPSHKLAETLMLRGNKRGGPRQSLENSRNSKAGCPHLCIRRKQKTSAVEEPEWNELPGCVKPSKKPSRCLFAIFIFL